ncbi:MAG TPA: MMPL family transporter [Solirubrobacteraceae bacterium]|nr:MMPL family transporter [Solirubrobacteraceae bacterium]
MSAGFERFTRAVARRPLQALLVVLLLAIGGAVLALRLKPSTGIGTFVGSGSSSYQATLDDEHHFGSDAVVVLIREPLTDLVETKDLGTLSFLEACLAGKVVQRNLQLGAYTQVSGQAPYGGWGSPCGRLMRSQPVKAVYGPATFLNHAVVAINQTIGTMTRGAQQSIAKAEHAAYALALGEHKSRAKAQQLAQAAGSLAQQQELQRAETLAYQSGLTSQPRIDNQQFISQVVFDATRGADQPKARFSYLFPTSRSALIQVRLKSSLTPSEQTQAISSIRAVVKMPAFRLGHGGRYTVTGAPVVLSDLSSTLTGSIALILLVALCVMALALLLVFRSTLRLLPLTIALMAAGITFGAIELAGGSLTLGSLAVLPILIGLAVDYAIQFQSRVQEARRDLPAATTAEAVATAARVGVPAIAAAALATATGFLVLLLSPVPLMRSFGVVLVVGIAVAFVCALVTCTAALVLADRDGGVVGASLRGAGEMLGVLARPAISAGRVLRVQSEHLYAAVSSRRASAVPRAANLMAVPLRRPGLVLWLALGLAVLGWVADTQTAVQSDVTKLVPSSMPALRDLHTLERTSGVSGEIDVTVRGSNVARPAVVSWMTRYEQSLLGHFGYAETTGCARATLCPALSLPDLFSTAGSTSAAPLSAASINSLLAAVPAYFKQAVITPDRREATLAFGIRLMPLARQQRVIDYMNSRLHPPAGVSARLAGIPVLAAQADATLSSSARRLLTLLAGLLAVGAALLAVFRRADRALLPLVPIALATGWSALIVFLTGIPLNPMSASLGTLVIAISTEFSVLLSERYRQERAAGFPLEEALRRTYRSTGAAVLASGITAIAGFGVLIVSSIPMLRDFGLVTVIDLAVSLAGVLLVLPATLKAAQHGALADRAGELGRRFGSRAARLRRRPSVV